MDLVLLEECEVLEIKLGNLKIDKTRNKKKMNINGKRSRDIDNEIEDPELNETQEYVKRIKVISDNSPVQRTKEWFAMRKDRVTASDVASCLKKNFIVCDSYIETYNLKGNFKKDDRVYCNPYSNVNDFILKKNGYGEFISNPATSHGNKLEEPALRFYESLTGKSVLEFGLMLHDTIPYLAASPDGICTDGTMLEIKCPYRRRITGLPPIYYWMQTQIQLEVAKLDICDFIECDIDMVNRSYWMNNKDIATRIIHQGENEETKCRSKGLFISFGTDKYIYPSRKYKSYTDMLAWAEKKVSKYSHLDPNPQILYYVIKEYSLVSIKKDTTWFNTILPMLKKVWDKVKSFKYEDYKDHHLKKNSKELDQGKTLDYRNKFDTCLLLDEDES